VLLGLGLGFLLRRYVVIVLSVLLGGIAGGIFLIVKPPAYTADAKILIGAPKPEFIQQQSLLTDAPLDQTQMETQFQLLLSKAILAPIVLKLKLADDPEFGSPSGGLIGRVFHVFTNSSSPQPKLDPTDTAISALTNRLTINRVDGVAHRNKRQVSKRRESSADSQRSRDGLHRRSAGRPSSTRIEPLLRGCRSDYNSCKSRPRLHSKL
jgi:uncharacterized protein involved in exopolysaccharide biosynthesis